MNCQCSSQSTMWGSRKRRGAYKEAESKARAVDVQRREKDCRSHQGCQERLLLFVNSRGGIIPLVNTFGPCMPSFARDQMIQCV